MSHAPVATDTSQYQDPYDDSYKRHVAIFRGPFGAHYLDPKFLANANWAAKAYERGDIVGAIVYTVWLASATPAEQFAFYWAAFGGKVPDWLIGPEIDLEVWRGASYEQHGDHSREINQLYAMHAHKMGAWTSVMGYGNAGDLAELYPHRDKRILLTQAKYGTSMKLDVPGAIAQQYTDGQTKWGVPAGYPHASAPFGPCDHNAFLGVKNARELRAALRPDKPAHTRPHTPRHQHRPPPRPYPAPAARSAAELIGAERDARVFVRGGRLVGEHHGKVAWTYPPEEKP